MLRMIEKARFILRSEKGQGLAEYALILVLISIAAIAVMPDLGDAIVAAFEAIAAALVPAAG